MYVNTFWGDVNNSMFEFLCTCLQPLLGFFSVDLRILSPTCQNLNLK